MLITIKKAVKKTKSKVLKKSIKEKTEKKVCAIFLCVVRMF
jgi:hypothetical protein